MAGFSKVPRKNKKGYAWKATIKKKGRILKSKTFSSISNAKTWALKLESNLEKMEALGSPGANITLSKLADEYMLKHTGKDISVDSKVGYWVDRIGDQYLADITTSDIRTLLKNYLNGEALRFDGMDHNAKARTKGIGRKRSPASRNRMKAQLSALFKFAIDEEFINVNPVKGIPALAENNERIRWLSEDERHRLMPVCQDSDWPLLYLLVFLAISTGARRGELLRLKWEDINFKDRSVLLFTTKNGSPRMLTFPRPAIQALMKYRKTKGLIFASKTKCNQPMDFRKHWLKALKISKIEDFRFHDLRHTAASYLVMNGATLYEVGEVLGHKNLETTKRYAHLSTEHKQALTDRVLGSIMQEVL